MVLSKGRRTVVRGARLTRGAATVGVPALDRGRWTVKVRYSGDARYRALPPTRSGQVTVRR
ncbi:hypothetical protein [Nocardioides sambongensis]|uniref:hypothetical protein n=1 Tax=Nocardioides sambongensis TaxID=2589074 RepID=UPI00112CE233|nr:hypothetical protein [Nocardioides sambongensis]